MKPARFRFAPVQRLCACVGVTLFVLAPLARAQVMQQIPADALVPIAEHIPAGLQHGVQR